MNAYNDSQIAQEYVKFLKSSAGQLQQQILLEAILRRLALHAPQQILDAACGSGWLTKILLNDYPETLGCDSSSYLIEYAKTAHPPTSFTICNLEEPLPYPNEHFDIVILNMAATDLENQKTAFQNLHAVLKPMGNLLVTIPNPFYAYPKGKWGRSLFDVLLFRKPKLYIQPPTLEIKNKTHPSWNASNPTSFYYTLAEHINNLNGSGFSLKHLEELSMPTAKIHTFQHPLLLLMEFKKIS